MFQISLKNRMLPLFKQLKNLKGLTMDPVLCLFKQLSQVQNFFGVLWNGTFWIPLTYYGINVKIANLDSFLQTILW